MTKKPRTWKGWAIMMKARTGRPEPLIFPTRQLVKECFDENEEPFQVVITEVVKGVRG